MLDESTLCAVSDHQARRRSSYRILVRHFFHRFGDQDALSPSGEPHASLAQILGLLAAPGAFFVLIFRPLGITGWDLIWVRYFFLSSSMVVLGFIMVLQWDALFPDRTDYQILTPLPVKPSTILLAKVSALGILLGIFLLDINFFGIFFWPGVDAIPNFRTMYLAHLTSVIGGGLFVALAMASLRGLLVVFFSGNLLRRLSVALQTLLMGVLVMLLFLTPLIGSSVRRLAEQGSPLLAWFPGYWFIGLYEQIRPAVGHPAVIAGGTKAWQALGLVTLLFLLTYLPGYRRQSRRIFEAPQPIAAGPGRLSQARRRLLHATVLRAPVERAVFHFITQTITRSMRHRLFLATYGGLGAALAVLNIGSGRAELLELPLTLSFILVSGLRAAFNFPSELRANWAFRISESRPVSDYLGAMRKWVVVCAILPLFAALAPLELIFFSWSTALFHLAYGITLSLLLIDVMFLGFQKVPFTCSYLPGKVNLTGLAVIYIYGFTTYSMSLARVEAWLIETPVAAAVWFGAAGVLHYALTRWDRRQLQDASTLDYQDDGDPAVRTLDLVSH
jgi:hypothetical protein